MNVGLNRNRAPRLHRPVDADANVVKCPPPLGIGQSLKILQLFVASNGGETSSAFTQACSAASVSAL